MKPLLFAIIGFIVGVVSQWAGEDYLQLKLANQIAQNEVWLQAHALRDREDTRLRQSMEKILNRIELMGCPRWTKPKQ